MKILNGFSWVAGGNIISKLLISLAYIIIAKILTVEAYGEFGIMKSTIDNFLIFATMGIGLTSTKYLSELRNTEKSKAGSILGAALLCVCVLGLVVCCLIWGFSKPIAINILKAEHLESSLIFVSFILLLTSFVGVQQGALVGLQSFRALSFSYIAQGILLIISLSIGAFLASTLGVMTGYLIAIVVLTLVTQVLLNKELKQNGIKLNLKQFNDSFKTIYLFAIPASLSTIISAPSNWVLNTTLARQDNGYYELGLYSATVIFAMGIRTLNTALGSVLLPIFLAEEASNSRKKEFVNYFLPWLIAIFLSMPFLIYPETLQLILGNKYPNEKIIPISSLVFITSIIIGHRQGISRDIIKKNKMWISAFSMFQWAVTTLAINYYLKGYGAYGLALSLSLGYLINLIVFVPVFIRLKLTPKFVFFDKYVIIIMCLILIYFLINSAFLSSPYRILLSITNTIIILYFTYKFIANYVR